MPYRMRGDRGAENKLVAVYIILKRGMNRASFIWGSPHFCSSTHNTRVERLWVEVGSQFARRWRGFFYRLEALHGLDRTNSSHLWLLHRLFLDMLNADCAEFQAQWNSHPISGAGHDQSPNDMYFLGKLQNGVYLDDCAGLNPDIIDALYGVHGAVRQRARGQTGAGQLSDEESDSEEDWEDIVEEVGAANEHHFHHEPVSVPKHAPPFSDNALRVFDSTLAEANRLQVQPAGYGIRPEEWENGTYPAFEILKSGRKGSKRLRIALPDSIWRPRAQLWVQALAVLDELTYTLEGLDPSESSDSDSDSDSG
ncbi:hypothetical protein B0H11DRAFT_2156948 [Mycena galericulata]|nr:hypothetical protein B0H11DRAFT_2161655 [Mycena galericulata]KAJ7487496.1 hypothetical protein B0H11DRAFT_2156948 [Mycena galericulata]